MISITQRKMKNYNYMYRGRSLGMSKLYFVYFTGVFKFNWEIQVSRVL